MSNIIKDVAKDYNVNSDALKRIVKESAPKPKKATRLEVLEVLYINAPHLFYCREDEIIGVVEYLDINLNVKLCYEIKSIKDGKYYDAPKI